MRVGPLGELLATDQRQALQFFIRGLLDVSEPSVDRQELLYNASVLAHYAQVSTRAALELPAPADLGEVFDHFVIDPTLAHDGLMMETAGAAVSAAGRVFARQMRGRHNIHGTPSSGQTFSPAPLRRNRRRSKQRCSVRSHGGSRSGVCATSG